MTDYEDIFASREAADCVVRAIAAVTGASYMDAHHAMAVCGRAHASGTSLAVARAALRFLGYDLVREWSAEELARECRVETAHVADLEGKGWLPRLIVHMNDHDHVAPFWDGHVQDWSANTEAAIDEAWEVQKTGVPSKRRTPPVIYL